MLFISEQFTSQPRLHLAPPSVFIQELLPLETWPVPKDSRPDFYNSYTWTLLGNPLQIQEFNTAPKL